MADRYDPSRDDAPVLFTGVPWADAEHVSPATLMATRYTHRNGTLVPLDVAFDVDGKPVNPYAPHNGRPGRGVLGKWGPNHASDPIVTRRTRTRDRLLVVYRAGDDAKRTPALPGGMVEVDPYTGTMDSFHKTMRREVLEEAVANDAGNIDAFLHAIDDTAYVVYAGYAPDPRNTRHAWIETRAFHVHLPEEVAEDLLMRDATDETTGAAWVDLNEDTLRVMYAGHAKYVRLAMVRIEGLLLERTVFYGIVSVAMYSICVVLLLAGCALLECA